MKVRLAIGCIMVILGSAPLRAAPAFAFSIKVRYSPKAAAALTERHEGVVASASFYGDPIAAARRYANEVGQLDVGRETITRSGPVSTIRFSGKSVAARHVAWLRNRAVEVNVNLYSARLSGPDNILACTFFQGSIEVARRAPIRLTCKLIGEA